MVSSYYHRLCHIFCYEKLVKYDHVLWLIALDCGTAPSLTNAIPQFDASAPTTYKSSPLRYECTKGQWFARGRTSVMAYCTVNRRWSINTSTSRGAWPTCTGESWIMGSWKTSVVVLIHLFTYNFLHSKRYFRVRVPRQVVDQWGGVYNCNETEIKPNKFETQTIMK